MAIIIITIIIAITQYIITRFVRHTRNEDYQFLTVCSYGEASVRFGGLRCALGGHRIVSACSVRLGVFPREGSVCFGEPAKTETEPRLCFQPAARKSGPRRGIFNLCVRRRRSGSSRGCGARDGG